MYHPGRTQTNCTFASLQRTFYPKHTSYYGDGSGRDLQITQNTGTLCRVNRQGMQGHHGVHLKQYNSNVCPRRSVSPFKDAPTFYYQSDGTGRDSYVLKDNGGLRPEYNVRNSGDRIFKSSLRNMQKSPIRSFKNEPMAGKVDFHTYQNWQPES